MGQIFTSKQKKTSGQDKSKTNGGVSSEKQSMTGTLSILHDHNEDFFMITDDHVTKAQANKIVPHLILWKYGGEEVSVSGSFDDWKEKIPLQKSADGTFSTKMSLSVGRYEYKYLVDGEWRYDEKQKTVNDHFGGSNNIIEIS